MAMDPANLDATAGGSAFLEGGPPAGRPKQRAEQTDGTTGNILTRKNGGDQASYLINMSAP